MTILGIDPGYATVGYGVLDFDGSRFTVRDFGAITTKAGLRFSRRLEIIYEGMGQLLERYCPDALAVEELFFNTNLTTGISVAHARGVILLAAAQKDIACFEYTPLQVKQSVVGYGRAEKQQVMQMTQTILGLSRMPRPDDAADALALAICHAHASQSLLSEDRV